MLSHMQESRRPRTHAQRLGDGAEALVAERLAGLTRSSTQDLRQAAAANRADIAGVVDAIVEGAR